MRAGDMLLLPAEGLVFPPSFAFTAITTKQSSVLRNRLSSSSLPSPLKQMNATLNRRTHYSSVSTPGYGKSICKSYGINAGGWGEMFECRCVDGFIISGHLADRVRRIVAARAVAHRRRAVRRATRTRTSAAALQDLAVQCVARARVRCPTEARIPMGKQSDERTSIDRDSSSIPLIAYCNRLLPSSFALFFAVAVGFLGQSHFSSPRLSVVSVPRFFRIRYRSVIKK
jgi:hypothetical protein